MALMMGVPGTAATAIKEGGSTQPLVSSSSFISSSKTESNKLLDVLDRTFRFLFLVGFLTEVFTGAMVALVRGFVVFSSLVAPITEAFAFFTGDFVTFTFELLSLALTTFHLALLLLLFLCEDVLAGVIGGGSLELLFLGVDVLAGVTGGSLELALVKEESCRLLDELLESCR